jgi:hypothetical protein
MIAEFRPGGAAAVAAVAAREKTGVAVEASREDISLSISNICI